ncbi:MAG: hypothetical protein GTO14_10450 [Anaerolineales bacterium]|nr:hypothetical protein [Anaerolineales bacterium]
MGRTLPSITNAFLQEQQSLSRFRRALRLEDQRALDDLLAASRHHLAAAAYASHLLPFETMLLAMLVEEHKEVRRLRQRLDDLQRLVVMMHPDPDQSPPLPSPQTSIDAADSGQALGASPLPDPEPNRPSKHTRPRED